MQMQYLITICTGNTQVGQSIVYSQGRWKLIYIGPTENLTLLDLMNNIVL